jgi:hypothetical protein
MKALHVEFVAPRAWLIVWTIAGLLLGAMVVSFAWKGMSTSRDNTRSADQSVAVRNELISWKLSKNTPAKPRDTSTVKAMSDVLFDQNKVFAVVESVDVSGTRLASFSFDAAAGILRIEYTMEAATKAAEITEALNAGYENRPWQLDRVTSTNPSTGAPPAGATPMNVVGSWSSKINSL